MLNKLRIICDDLIKKSEDNIFRYTRLEYIKKLLEDDKIFFKISLEEAYSILRDLDFLESEYTKIYKELINEKNF